MRKKWLLYLILLFVLSLFGCDNDKNNATSNIPSSESTPTVIPTSTNTPTSTNAPTNTPTPTTPPTCDSIVNDYPYSEYIYGQIYEQSTIEDLPVYSAVEPEYIAIDILSNLNPGQAEKLHYEVLPRNAYGRLKFSSSDENVAVVDEFGIVTALNAGYVTITATAPNGVFALCDLFVNNNYANLTFELTQDGSGYVITGCDNNVFTVNIPATHEGKPVKEIAGRAFIDCSDLRFFTADPDQEFFYAVDGVLYTDMPVKTLVRMPNAYCNQYQPLKTYKVLPDTKAIGDYALAGLGGSSYGFDLFLPDGLTTMGDCVFCEIHTQTSVYVPDSLKTIGKDITLNQFANVPFFGNWECYANTYCDEHNVPFGGYFIPEGDYSDVATTFIPVSYPADSYVAPNSDRIAFVQSDYYGTTNWYEFERIDISEEQLKGKDEVRILFETYWRGRIPDKYGNKASAFPAMTGVYGMGYTEEACELVAYGIDGKPIAMMNVNKGDFVFSFKGAASLGVVGGKNTEFCVVPDEPLFVNDSGYINLKPEIWHVSDYGKGYRTIISCFMDGNYSMYFPQTINEVSSISVKSSAGTGPEVSHYRGINLTWNDDTRLDQSGLWYIHCDGLEPLYESDFVECYAKQTLNLTSEYGEKVEHIFDTLKGVMVGNYFPKDVEINKIKVYLDGSYPACGNSTLFLDDYCADVDSSIATYTHELTHAIDQSIPFCNYLAPSPWLEGRAEYISRFANDKLNTYSTYYSEEGDWSFLTDQDKADFLHFYCLNNNRHTPYYVGFYFLKYLNDTYGEDISSKIMEAMSKVEVDVNFYDIDEETRMNMFGDIVKAATCDTVFQDFVRDVVEK